MAGKLRSMEPHDIPFVIDIHTKSFQGFFLTFLGVSFLRELYQGIIADSSGIGLVYENSGDVQGFVVGTDLPTGLYRRLLIKRWWRFAMAALFPSIRDPKIIPRLLRALNLPNEVTNEPGKGTLMSIAVAPNVQGTGIGNLLISEFLREAKKRGLNVVNLTTDAVDNDPVNHFYLNCGFIQNKTFTTPDGRVMHEYIMELE